MRPLTPATVLVPVLTVRTSAAFRSVSVKVPAGARCLIDARWEQVSRSRLGWVQRTTDEVRLAVPVLETGSSVVVLTRGAQKSLQLSGTVRDALADVNGRHSGGTHRKWGRRARRTAHCLCLLSTATWECPSPSATALHSQLNSVVALSTGTHLPVHITPSEGVKVESRGGITTDAVHVRTAAAGWEG